MSQTRPFDPHIPVLTELFSDKGEAPPEPLVERAPASAADAEWEALEQRLSERIVQQLQGSVDILLEQRLEQLLRQALAGLGAELRQGMQASIDGIVARALAQERGALQALRQPPE